MRRATAKIEVYEIADEHGGGYGVGFNVLNFSSVAEAMEFHDFLVKLLQCSVADFKIDFQGFVQ